MPLKISIENVISIRFEKFSCETVFSFQRTWPETTLLGQAVRDCILTLSWQNNVTVAVISEDKVFNDSASTGTQVGHGCGIARSSRYWRLEFQERVNQNWQQEIQPHDHRVHSICFGW